MYAIAGKMATSIAAIIITDIIMEKYDVRSKVKERYTQACAGLTGLAAKVRLTQGEDKSATSKEETQETARVSLTTRFTIWEAGIQLRLADRAERKANECITRAIAHARYCRQVAVEYKHNYIHTVSINEWAGPEDEKELANV